MSSKALIYLAPFQGITGVAFRSVYTRYFGGVDKLFTPFFTNIPFNYKISPRQLTELGISFENGVEVVPQILSKDAGEIIRFAHFCKNMGFNEINWNLGCPYPQVANKKRGSGLLPYPEMVEQIIGNVFENINIKFSIKCRLGYFSPDEIFRLIPIFNTFPISELIIHARIGKQLYTGNTDLITFSNVLTELKTPVVYNGDIFSVADYANLRQRFPELTNFMIGRGLLYDPFLPAEIKSTEISLNKKEHVKRFIEDLYLVYRKQKNNSLSVIGSMKEYWSYLSRSFDDPHRVFKKVKKTNTFNEYEEAVFCIFNVFNWIGSGK